MMRTSVTLFLGAFATLLAAFPAQAIDIDGTRDAGYQRYATQTVTTGFGDNENEWNAAYASIEGSILNMIFTGNLQPSFNKLEVFVDSVPGGSNVLETIGNDGSGAMNGMTFDIGFEPDYHFIFRNGNFGGDKFDVDFATLNSGALGPGSLIIDGNGGGGGENIFGGSLEGSASNIGGTSLSVGFNNSNTAGIVGCPTPNDSPPNCPAADPVAAQAVTTGLEIGIELAEIGSPTGPIKVMLLQNNDNHSFLSNQSLGGMPAGTGNLGSSFYTNGNSALADFNQFDGNQFFTVPEPAACLLLGLAACLVGVLRRRS